MKFALIQMNPTVGAVRDNAAKIVRLAQAAADAGAGVAVRGSRPGLNGASCRVSFPVRNT